MKTNILNYAALLLLFCAWATLAGAQVVWGNGNSRTETRDDAGLQGNAGALSGFFETVNPANYPSGATSWWHLLDVRHSNPNNNYAMQFAGGFFDQNLYFRKTLGSPATAWSRVLLETNGRVGIGTTSPTMMLDVFDLTPLGTAAGSTIDIANIHGNNAHNAQVKFLLKRHTTGNAWFNASTRIQALTDITNQGYIDFNPINGPYGMALGVTNWNGTDLEALRVDISGNIGIGTMAPAARLDVNGAVKIGSVSSLPAGYGLYVADGILTEKVKVAVKTSADWSDHVFADDYRLLPVAQLEQFIKTNKRLPNIPSATEMTTTGNNLGQTDARLLEKIEELTLYIIQQQKQIQQLEQKLNALNNNR